MTAADSLFNTIDAQVLREEAISANVQIGEHPVAGGTFVTRMFDVPIASIHGQLSYIFKTFPQIKAVLEHGSLLKSDGFFPDRIVLRVLID